MAINKKVRDITAFLGKKGFGNEVFLSQTIGKEDFVELLIGDFVPPLLEKSNTDFGLIMVNKGGDKQYFLGSSSLSMIKHFTEDGVLIMNPKKKDPLFMTLLTYQRQQKIAGKYFKNCDRMIQRLI